MVLEKRIQIKWVKHTRILVSTLELFEKSGRTPWKTVHS